jgi:hypothetical protein
MQAKTLKREVTGDGNRFGERYLTPLLTRATFSCTLTQQWHTGKPPRQMLGGRHQNLPPSLHSWSGNLAGRRGFRPCVNLMPTSSAMPASDVELVSQLAAPCNVPWNTSTLVQMALEVDRLGRARACRCQLVVPHWGVAGLDLQSIERWQDAGWDGWDGWL